MIRNTTNVKQFVEERLKNAPETRRILETKYPKDQLEYTSIPKQIDAINGFLNGVVGVLPKDTLDVRVCFSPATLRAWKRNFNRYVVPFIVANDSEIETSFKEAIK